MITFYDKPSTQFSGNRIRFYKFGYNELMNTQNESKKPRKNKSGTIRHWKKYLISSGIIAGIIAAALLVWLSIGSSSKKTEPVTSGEEFKNLGMLTTQEALITQVDVIDESRTILGVDVPFTNSKSIYSYDVRLKAAVDFEKIHYERTNDEDNGTITYHVYIPDAAVTDCYVDQSSFKLYEERESLFKNISMELTNERRVKLEENARQRALDDGFLERANQQAENLITSFLEQDNPGCKVEFVNEEYFEKESAAEHESETLKTEKKANTEDKE